MRTRQMLCQPPIRVPNKVDEESYRHRYGILGEANTSPTGLSPLIGRYRKTMSETVANFQNFV